jgi:DNA-binding NtrC family response regulator
MIGGHHGAAARLGLPRTTLLSKMSRLGIHRRQSSASALRAAGA